MQNKQRLAFIKFGGLSSGGTEKWLQMMAANVNRSLFEVTYFYCDTAPYIGSDYIHPTTDVDRFNFLSESNVTLKKFHVGAKDVTSQNHEWIETDFWNIFDESLFDIVITAKAGPAEYPFTEIKLPIIEYVTLGVGVDTSSSIKWSVHCSEWQRRRWIRMGGRGASSSSLPIPYFEPSTDQDYRRELGIPEDAFVIGMHQRAEDTIYSDIPLLAFSQVSDLSAYFILMGGSEKYLDQSKRLGLKNFINIPHSADEKAISKFLNTLDVFAHGRSDGETFGTVFAEAMAHGLPIVTHYSENGANAQAETIGPAGRCVSTSREYADFLIELRDNSTLYKVLSSKALEFSEANFSLESVVRQFEKVALGVLGRNDVPASSNRLSFGRSPLGYLQFGELDNPASIAHHIVEESIPEEYDLLIARYFLEQSKVFYDVGANIGLYCFLGAQINSNLEIVCFEPQKDCVAQLEQSIYLNNWENRISICNSALSDRDDDVKLYLAGSGSSIESDFVGTKINESSSVPSRQLDSLYFKAPDFIKIDVEGHEYKTLCGATQTIKANLPIIFLELVDNIPARNYVNQNFASTLQLLFALNYRIYRSDGNGILNRVRSTKSHDGILMYLCIPKNHKLLSVLPLRVLLVNTKLRKSFKRLIRYLRKKVVLFARKCGI